MKNKVGTVAVLVGTILVALGLFLPFYSVGGESVNLVSIVNIVWLVAAIVALLFAFIGNKIVTLITALVAGGGMLLAFFMNSDSGLLELAALVSDFSKGLGYWCTLIGGIVMILAGIVYFITTKSDAAEA